jgi:hypothetical protein
MLNINNEEYKFQMMEKLETVQCCIRPYEPIEFILNDVLFRMMEAMDLVLANYRKDNPNDPEGEPSPMGFAWIEVHSLKPTSRKYKALEAIGFKKSLKGQNILEFYPTESGKGLRAQTYWGQSLPVQEVGCRVFIEALKDYGQFSHKIYMHSILARPFSK